MSDAEIDIAMPENPEPGEQPEDPLEDEEYEGVDDPAGQQTKDDDDTEANVELEVKEIVPDQEVFLDAPKQAPPKKQRARKPPSEKQLAHLAKIRVKAVEAKRAKNAAKKSIKAEVSEVPQKKSIKAKEVPEKFVDAEGGLVHLTQEQLRQLQYEAIHGYDTMRKERKTKKKAAEAKDKQEKQVYAAVSKAINPSADDGWGVCFQ
tara:strand:- start:84 stop:698 length:615 start_codon:yes stop_codon:yes gene_type:complete